LIFHYTADMKNTKVSPVDRKIIYKRYESKEKKQVELAYEYDVSPAYISKIIKEEEARLSNQPPMPHDRKKFKNVSEVQLRTSYLSLGRQIDTLLSQKASYETRCDRIRAEIFKATEEMKTDPKLKGLLEKQILAYRKQITELSDQHHFDETIRDNHREMAEIVTELLSRGIKL